MAVIHSTIFRVKPGRLEDMLSMTLESLKVHERLDVRTGRLMTAAVAGEASGVFAFSTEFTDVEAYATFADEAARDHEMQTLFARAQAADSPVVLEQQSLATEIPLGRTPRTGRGTVLEIHVTRPTPGRFDETLAMAGRVAELVERHGARNARVFQLGYAGICSGMLMSSWECDSVRAWAKVSAAWQTDPEGQAIAATLTAASPTSTLVFSGLYNEVPV
ncbi:MAG TPA: hypothetical protein VE991_10245 [Acidimicrobiales bacterium]|nr:hypothetical protein [Acidimicrobiales bacterium]